MRILVRCDASAELGLGHATRSLALAEALALRLRDSTIEFLAREEPLLARFLGGRCVSLLALRSDGYGDDAVLEELGRGPCVLVSDTNELDERSLARVAATATPHVVVDDFARLAAWPCDIVVNPNTGAEASHYRGAGLVLAGPRFALLRGEVRVARGRARRHARARGRRLLVCLGGGRWSGAAHDVVAALARLRGSGIDVRVAAAGPVPAGLEAVPPASLPDQLVWADAAVLSGGVLKYEAAACGLPALLVAVTGHQEAIARRFSQSGAAEYLGVVEALRPAAVEAAAAALLADAGRREAMRRAGRRLVDARGAERVARALSTRRGLR